MEEKSQPAGRQERATHQELQTVKQTRPDGGTAGPPPDLILANTPAIIVTLDLNWQVVALNPYAETLTGIDSGRAIGKDWFSTFVPQHSRQHAREVFQAGIEEAGSCETITLVKAADGTEHQVEWRLQKLAESGESGPIVIAIGIDVTEREWKDEHRQLLTSMVEQSTEGMAIIDTEGNIIFLNRACAEMHGYSSIDLIGEPFSVFCPPQEKARSDAIRKCIEGKGEFSREVLNLRRDGTRFPVLVHASGLRDEQNTPIGFVCTMRDISEQNQAKAALRQQELRLRTVVDNAPVILWAVDAEGRFTLSEGKGLSSLGLRPGEVVGQSVFDLYREIPKIPAAVRRALAGESFTATVRVRDLTYDCRYAPLRNEKGEVTGVIGLATDISERKLVEEALRSRVRQQTAVAELGQRGLAGLELESLMEEAVSLVAENLGVEFAKVLELLPEAEMLLRAGVGWREGYVGKARVSAGEESQAGYTLLSSEPVIVEDLRSERRFSGPPLLLEHDTVSGVSVIIPGPQRPFGVLGAHTRRRRAFTHDDIHFLQAVANILAETIERKRSEEQHARLAKAVEQTPESIIITDVEANIEYVNPAFERITGYGLGEAIGQNPRILKSGKHDSQFYRQMWDTLTAGKTWSGEMINKRKDGSLYREQATISPVVDETGKIVNYVAVKRELNAGES